MRFLICALLCLTVQAEECRFKLMDRIDSDCHSMLLPDIKYNRKLSLEEKAFQVVRELMRRHGCDVKTEMATTRIDCQTLLPEPEFLSHDVCVIQTRTAYYIVAPDWVDSYNVIVGRYD